MSRPGFTLLEVMIALLITSVVALLVHGLLRAGLDTQDRLERQRADDRELVALRGLLTHALRHPIEGGGDWMNDTIFALDDRVSPEGLPADQLHFLSRGLEAPYGSGPSWLVSLAPAQNGLALWAGPAGAGSPALRATLGRARGLNIRVLARSDDAEWSDRWDAAGRGPAAVAIEFLSERGLPVGAPLVVHTALERVW